MQRFICSCQEGGGGGDNAALRREDVWSADGGGQDDEEGRGTIQAKNIFYIYFKYSFVAFSWEENQAES